MKIAQLLIFLLTITFSLSATAQGSFVSTIGTVKANQQAKQRLAVKSSKQAAQMAKGRYGGKVLKVQKQKSGYRVKLIKNDGHIVSVFVDAKSGRISGGH
ncbi:MAG: PepSY domain-containing protein [Colwellia sp.]|nr:PepSY domain-containing protein [Colwellia sp.]MCW8863778.1 PepSY domain-containing protein [Colwellia sp.]MCW9081959.1 PepSY domain-containing protein [Colwellia sp.]